MTWQRTARLVIAVAAIAFAVVVAFTLRRRATPRVETPLMRTDPQAIVESAGGQSSRVNREHEELRLDYDKLLTYADGTTKMVGVTVRTERSGRTFVIAGREGRIGKDESTVELEGDVRVTASDGMVITTERATYTEVDGMARAPGAVQFSRGRLSGSGLGFTYDKHQDILTILDQAVAHVDANEKGGGAMDVTSGVLEFRRNEKTMLFDRGMKATRAREVIEADRAIAHLRADQEDLEALELRGGSRITASGASAGGLQALTGRDIDLKYGPDGQAIEHAAIRGDAVMQLAGETSQPGRQISAGTIDLTLAPDGTTPTALVAKERVRMTLPAERGGITRTVSSQALESQGDARRSLSSARFTGDVQFAERGPSVNRGARAAALDAQLAPGIGSIEDARFTRNVRFVDGPMTATAAAARYVLKDGTLELAGSDSGGPPPHVVNDRITVDAARVVVTLEGPLVKAEGTVKSVLQPARHESDRKSRGGDVRMPSMLKQDQPVNVTAECLDYDGRSSRATYEGSAQLWQAETRINAPLLTIDGSKGDLNASGTVATVTVLMQEGKDGKKERVRSQGAATEFSYQDADRRATYTGEAHLTGPQGDLTAPKIELFLTPSGDELERVEAYEAVVLRADTRKTTGARLTYFGEEGRYLVSGAPVTIVDNCGRETTGRTLTFYRSTDRIVVDGNEQVRTQTKGKSNCPGT